MGPATPLYNTIDKKIRKKQVLAEKRPRQTFSFYCYTAIDEPVTFRAELYRVLTALDVYGRIYLAREGVNAQYSLPRDNVAKLGHFLSEHALLSAVVPQPALEEHFPSFYKLTIKIRPYLVAIGDLATESACSTPHTPSTIRTLAGPALAPVEFHNALAEANAIAVDVRNHYEHEIGHFSSSVRLAVDTFREALSALPAALQAKKAKHLYLYCTGGIRCERASAYLLRQGFKHVYQLRGGIIAYAHAMRKHGLTSRFIGRNFVFDDRLSEEVTPDLLAKCHQCATPCARHTNCKYEDCHLLFIQCPTCQAYFNGCCSAACQEKHALPLAQQRKLRQTGQPKPNALAIHKTLAALTKIDQRPTAIGASSSEK